MDTGTALLILGTGLLALGALIGVGALWMVTPVAAFILTTLCVIAIGCLLS